MEGWDKLQEIFDSGIMFIRLRLNPELLTLLFCKIQFRPYILQFYSRMPRGPKGESGIPGSIIKM